MRGFHHPKLPNSNSFTPRNLLHQMANLTRHWPMKMGFSSFSTPQIAGSSSICKAFRHICCQFPLKIRPGTPTRTTFRREMQQKRGEEKNGRIHSDLPPRMHTNLAFLALSPDLFHQFFQKSLPNPITPSAVKCFPKAPSERKSRGDGDALPTVSSCMESLGTGLKLAAWSSKTTANQKNFISYLSKGFISFHQVEVFFFWKW